MSKPNRRIGGVIVIVLPSSVVDHNFDQWSGPTRQYNWYMFTV